MAGFQLVEDGVEAATEAVVDGVKDTAEVLTGSDIDGDGKIADTPVDPAPEAPAETPAVEVTTEVVDDGSKNITLEVATEEAAPETPVEEAPTPTEEAPAEAPKKATPPAKKK